MSDNMNLTYLPECDLKHFKLQSLNIWDDVYNNSTCLEDLLGRLIAIMCINAKHVIITCYMTLVPVKLILVILLLGTILVPEC